MRRIVPNPNDALIVRWLAIAGAAGAAAAAAMGHFSDNWLWHTLAMIAALLAVAGVPGLWRAFRMRDPALEAAAPQSGRQVRGVSALQDELAVPRPRGREPPQ